MTEKFRSLSFEIIIVTVCN